MKTKKLLAIVLSMAMILSLSGLFKVSASAEDQVRMGFHIFKVTDEEVGATIRCKVNSGQWQDVLEITPDAGGNRWINDLAQGDQLAIQIKVKEGYQIDNVRGVTNGIQGNGTKLSEGDIAQLSSDGGYLFTIDETGNYEFEVGFLQVGESGNPGGDPQPGDDGKNWTNDFDQILAPGVNFVTSFIGNAEGPVTYQFSNDLSLWSDPATISAKQQKDCQAILRDDSQGEAEVTAAKAVLFGIPTNGKYIKIRTNDELCANHLEFTIYQRDSQGRLVEKQNASPRYLDLRQDSKEQWLELYQDPRCYEDFLMGREKYDQQGKYYEGLILDISNMEEGDILKCSMQYDTRNVLGWWNGKYKELVEAAGDHVSEDQYLYHGTAELVSVIDKQSGAVLYSNDSDWKPEPDTDENLVVALGKAGYDHGSLRPGYSQARGKFSAREMLEAAEYASGECLVPPNTEVTVKLIPEEGYQILGATLNGMALNPSDESPSEFTFTMGTNNYHFQGLFEKTANTVDTDALKTGDAKVSIKPGMVDSGNISVEMSTNSAYNTAKATNEVAGTAVTAMDIQVDKIIAKAGNLNDVQQQLAKDGALEVTNDNYWIKNMKEVAEDITFNVNVNNVKLAENETLVVVREHEGQFRALPTSVSNVAGKTSVSFASDLFSTFTVVKTKKSTSSKLTAAPVRLKKVTNAKGKKLVVKWKATPNNTGYKLQYSTDKKFKKKVKTITIKNAKTATKTISKLKKKTTYYVRICGYKTGKVGEKTSTVNSKWSAVKKVKIKK